ncbi:hypothetical protein LNTAR_11236 [Lentisphaera araneosa HTCC2155]|uniref:Uncharacterized protein n=1 Tax=Lentisphaera araneosa HTCC2155 TaxID=313628 RepID=A6DJ50_9BACT|nr:beta-propeller fold lactonase family protein [Lentisphaera araneosa]EDM28486.1 hypothetical protein LNTAR_11236 [Lentisphaera araneosa HTCC2155]
MKYLLNALIALIFLGPTVYAEQYFYLLNKKGKSIDQYLIQDQNGDLTFIKSLKFKKGLSSLAPANNGKYIYTISNSELQTLSVGEKGSLTVKGTGKVSLSGAGQLSADGRYYVMYHYRANQVSVQAMRDYVSTGKQVDLLTTTDHPHDIKFSNDGDFVFVPHNWDNRLYQFKFNKESGKLSPLAKPFITGPDLEKKGYANFRSLVQHPQQKVLYCTYEKGGGVVSLKYDKDGLEIWQEFSTVREATLANPSKLALSHDGRFLFISNRAGKDGNQGSIAVFSLDIDTGEILKRVGVYLNKAMNSREIIVDRSGKFLYSSSQKDKSTIIYHINNDGALKFFKELKIRGGPMIILER